MTPNLYLRCYRFGSSEIHFSTVNTQIQTHRRILNTFNSRCNMLLAGVDEVWYITSTCSEKKYLIESILDIKEKSEILVLTKKEKKIILKCGSLTSFKIFVFEEIYPFIKKIKYISDAKKNLENLLINVKQIKKYNLNFNYIQTFYNSISRKINRKIKYFSSLDRNFFYIPISPYQEVFKLSEIKINKKIVAFDYNSMYSSVMNEDFPDPEFLNYYKYNIFFNKNFKIMSGMYKVILSEPDVFIKEYHAIKYVNELRAYPFKIKKTDSIETILTSDELEFYSTHFNKIFIIDAILSTKQYHHPLLKNAIRLFKIRKHYTINNNKSLASLYKLYLTILHSVTNGHNKSEKIFKTANDLLNYLKERYGLNKDKNISNTEFLIKLRNRNFEIYIKNDGIHCKLPKIDSSSNIYSLYSFVIAKARVRMMKILEKLTSFPSVSICYCNVDSIHISINSDNIETLFSYLKSMNMIGNEFGQMKIEAIADKGFWFCPGRYWLLDKNDNIIQFKNICIDDHIRDNNFIRDHRKVIYGQQFVDSIIPLSINIDLKNSFSVRKQLINNSFKRFSSEQINDNFTKISQENFFETRKKLNSKIMELKSKLKKH